MDPDRGGIVDDVLEAKKTVKIASIVTAEMIQL